MENYINKTTFYDEINYQRTVYQWRNSVFPVIRWVAEKYRVLAARELTQPVFEEMVSKGFQGLDGVIRISSLAGCNVDNLRSLTHALQQLFHTHYNASGASDYARYIEMPWGDVVIIDGQPHLQEEKIRKRHEFKIASEDQNELYNKMIAVKQGWNDLLAFVQQKGYNTKDCVFTGKNGFLFINEDSSLEINPKSINFL
ncbi:MAG TPA: hypothetical protein VGN63_19515 [Flavisolibacter sp.]|jgi:hypothetical protein|nr:hypothetical protein [Flavisolibacter sp.]